MLDVLLKGARLPGQAEAREIGIRDGLIAKAEPDARQVMDLGGALVTPALVEPHIHLDAVLTVGEPRHNLSGSLVEGIAIWAERGNLLSVDDVKRRVRTVLRWQLANGVQFVRSHIDVCDPELRAVRALTELREEIGDQMKLQLVAFPQQGIMSFDGG
ncbi:MAG: cytosine/creatinine deaminase, partial [Chloroflexota bacterium]|nr:cytosine/creatinine deaminase [Chloroflexota bacterium]